MATNRYFEEAQALTRALPTQDPATQPVSPTRPLVAQGSGSYLLTVVPPAGAYFTGSGYVRIYFFSAGRWGYLDEDRALTNGAQTVDLARMFGMRLDLTSGFLLPAAVGVGVSSGSTVTVRLERAGA